MVTFILTTGLLLGSSVAVCAQDVPDLNKTGSITVEMRYDQKAVTGGELALYKVGNAKEENGDYGFLKTDDFSGFPGDITATDSEELPDQLKKYISQNKIKEQVLQKNSDGEITFDNLNTGLYLIIQTQASDGYEAMNPFLVNVPLLEDGKYVYQINAKGKFELKKSEMPEGRSEKQKVFDKHLPQTGQMKWPIPILAVGGVILFLLGWLLKAGGKKE